jgi:hypothetical protein
VKSGKVKTEFMQGIIIKYPSNDAIIIKITGTFQGSMSLSDNLDFCLNKCPLYSEQTIKKSDILEIIKNY